MAAAAVTTPASERPLNAISYPKWELNQTKQPKKKQNTNILGLREWEMSSLGFVVEYSSDRISKPPCKWHISSGNFNNVPKLQMWNYDETFIIFETLADICVEQHAVQCGDYGWRDDVKFSTKKSFKLFIVQLIMLNRSYRCSTADTQQSIHRTTIDLFEAVFHHPSWWCRVTSNCLQKNSNAKCSNPWDHETKTTLKINNNNFIFIVINGQHDSVSLPNRRSYWRSR